MRPGTWLRSRDTSVDFPEPDGAEMIKTVVINGSFQVQRLLPDFVDFRLRGESQVCNGEAKVAESAGFREDGVRLAVHLLQQEIQAFADFAFAGQHVRQMGGMGAKADELFGDVAAVGENGGFLSEALGIERGAFEEFVEAFAEALLESG